MFIDVKITTDNLVIVTRSFPLRQKPSILSLPQVTDRATQTGKAGWHTGFQIPAAQGGMGTEEEEQAPGFYSVFPTQAINSGSKICKQCLGSEPTVNYFSRE